MMQDIVYYKQMAPINGIIGWKMENILLHITIPTSEN